MEGLRSLCSQSSVGSASVQQPPASGPGKMCAVVACTVATTAVGAVVVSVDVRPLSDFFWPQRQLWGWPQNKRDGEEL